LKLPDFKDMKWSLENKEQTIILLLDKFREIIKKKMKKKKLDLI